MIGYYVLTALTFFSLFALFLVLSNTLNSIISQLVKLEYMFQREFEFKEEQKRFIEQYGDDEAED